MTPVVSQNYPTSPHAGWLLLPFSWQPCYKSFGVTLFSFASSLTVLTSFPLVKEKGCNDFSWRLALLSPSTGTVDLFSCRTPAQQQYSTASVCPFPRGPKALARCMGRRHIQRAGNVTMLSCAQMPDSSSEINSSKTSLPMSATPY